MKNSFIKPGSGRVTFTIVLDAQEVIVHYEPHWMRDVGQFEFESPHDPRRPIPISETGYKSHFAAMEAVEAAPSPQEYAQQTARAILHARRRRCDIEAENDGQLPLF
jgi:hypothetical protein